MSSLISSAPGACDNPHADFSDTPGWLPLVKALLVFVFLLVNTLVVIWFERRVIGRMQQRPGPNRTGPFGLLQTLADGIKLALKEDLTPKNADKVVFALAPAIAGAMAFVSFAIIPMGPMVCDVRPPHAAAAHRHPRRGAARARGRGRRASTASSSPAGPPARPTRCSVACARPPRSSPTRSPWACPSSRSSSTAARCRPRRSSSPRGTSGTSSRRSSRSWSTS